MILCMYMAGRQGVGSMERVGWHGEEQMGSFTYMVPTWPGCMPAPISNQPPTSGFRRHA